MIFFESFFETNSHNIHFCYLTLHLRHIMRYLYYNTTQTLLVTMHCNYLLTKGTLLTVA